MAGSGLIKAIGQLTVARTKLEKLRDNEERGSARHGKLAVSITRLEEALFWAEQAEKCPGGEE